MLYQTFKAVNHNSPNHDNLFLRHDSSRAGGEPRFGEAERTAVSGATDF